MRGLLFCAICTISLHLNASTIQKPSPDQTQPQLKIKHLHVSESDIARTRDILLDSSGQNLSQKGKEFARGFTEGVKLGKKQRRTGLPRAYVQDMFFPNHEKMWEKSEFTETLIRTYIFGEDVQRCHASMIKLLEAEKLLEKWRSTSFYIKGKNAGYYIGSYFK